MSRILIIDDEEDLLIPLSSLLNHLGFEVAALSRGTEALKTVDSFKPDLILLDIKLEDVDGRDICYELKAKHTKESPKVLLYSAYLSKEDAFTQYGADDFLEKPFQLKDLVEKINHHLGAAA